MGETNSGVRDILVIIDSDRRAAMAAAEIARRTGAHLNGIALTFEALLPVYTVAAPIPTELLVANHDQSLNQAEQARRDFDAIAAKANVNGQLARRRDHRRRRPPRHHRQLRSHRPCRRRPDRP